LKFGVGRLILVWSRGDSNEPLGVLSALTLAKVFDSTILHEKYGFSATTKGTISRQDQVIKTFNNCMSKTERLLRMLGKGFRNEGFLASFCYC